MFPYAVLAKHWLNKITLKCMFKNTFIKFKSLNSEFEPLFNRDKKKSLFLKAKL